MAATAPDETLSNNYINKLQKERYEIFKSQDQEKGRFDVTFDIGGKQLHANTFILTTVSETFNSLLSDRWMKKDEPVKITDYSFNDFYEFISFLYTGSCALTFKNISTMIDMAEFYAVPCFKDYCDQFMSKMFITVNDIEEMHEIAMKYSLPDSVESIKQFISWNDIYKNEKFLAFKKPFVEFLSTLARRWDYDVIRRRQPFYECSKTEGKFFEIVYKWAEHQVLQQRDLNDKNFNLEEAVKAELSTILPQPKFYGMSFTFLMDFVLEKGFLLSPTELSEFFEFLQSVCRSCKKIFPFLQNSYHSYRKKHVQNPNDAQNEDSRETVEKPESEEETFFECVYRLAEKQARKKKQMLAPDSESFSVANSIKADLAEVIPLVKFYEMDKQYVMNFVAAKGLITEEQANLIFLTQVHIESNGKTISGSFDDQFGIRVACEKLPGYSVERRNTTKICFPKLKFSIPKKQSTVKKMKGVEWYLCLEKNQMLSLKHHSVVGRSDYLIAEMKGDNDFELVPGEETSVKASYNNVQF